VSVSFFVPGIPKPGGSKRAFIPKGWKRAIITEDCKGNKDWRASVAQVASEHIYAPFLKDLKVEFTFYMPRPKSHYNAKGFIKGSFLSTPHTKKPDLTKLIRASEDAMTGIVWHDDSQIIEFPRARKLYAMGKVGMEVTIE